MPARSFRFAVLSLVALPQPFARLQARQMTVEEYEPRSTLVVEEHSVRRARFPFVDVHGHVWRPPGAESLAAFVGEMDKLNSRSS